MSIVQVRRVPEELHMAMKERAKAQGLSLNDFLLDVMRREMALPSLADWLEEVGAARGEAQEFRMSDLMDAVRGDLEA